ncbi:MAG TPA: PAS domain S-box protein [Methanosarcinaceae archaeon]|nr:PAS domain S-box protein [Methanosarcinaceae archaeon]
MSGIRALNKALTNIDVQLPPKQYIKNILEVTCDNLDYLFGTVIEINEKSEAHMIASHNLPENYPEIVNKVKAPILSGPAGEAFETCKIVVLHDPFSDPRLAPWNNLRVVTGIIEIMVWVPLFKNGKVFGICVLYGEKERDTTQDELSSLEQIGVMMSIAIASNKYLHQLNKKTQELQESRDELEIRVKERTAELSNTNTELQLFKDLINQSNDAIFVADPKTSRFLEINDKTCTVLRLAREEILNIGVTDLEMFKDNFSWKDHVKEVKERGSLILEREFKKKDHPVATVEINMKYLVHENKEYMIAIVRNITERKNAERILQEEKKFSASLIQNCAIPAFAVDSQHKIIHWNKACEGLTGIEAENMIGTSDYGNVFHGCKRPCIVDCVIDGNFDELSKYYTKYGKSIYSPDGLYAEDWIQNIGGKKRYLIFDATPIKNNKGELIAVVQTLQDMTQLKQDEEVLTKYTEELQHSNELKNLFGDVLHHDLLNPAGIIKGYTEILLNAEKDQKKVQALKVIERNTGKLINLVETASKLAKLESVDDIEFHKTNLCNILKATIDDFEPELNKKQITIEFTQKNNCFVNVNPLVKEVFVNLLSNAIKYGGDKNKIIVNASDTEEDWTVTVTDFGIGIPDEDKPHLFERFKRMDKLGIKGMGLGLAIVKRIVDLHGGRVGVEDNPKGQGSVFWVTLKKT